MALVTASQPSLIGGVSQQPEVLRPPSSAEAQENAYSSVVDGLIKRHPLNHVTEFAWTTDFIHTISRDEVEKYFLVIDDNGILRVHDPLGNEYFLFETGLGSDYLTYLGSGSLPAKERFRAVTIADTTIIVNREVVVEPSPTTGDSPLILTWRAFVYLKVGAFATRYTIRIKTRDMTDLWQFRIKTWKGTDGTQVWTQDNPTAYRLETGGVGASGYFQTSTDLLAEAFADKINIHLGAGGLNVVQAAAKDGVLMMTAIDQFGLGDSFDPDDPDTVFEIIDGLGNSAMTKIWKTADRLSDLPRTFLHDYRVNISGDESDNQDDFTVRFEGEDSTVGGLQEGKWAEFYEYGATIRIGVSTTLPLKMTRKFDPGGVTGGPVGTIYFELRNDFTVWDEKQAGNDETNPEPSFTGETINEVFFFDNRLGFLTGQNVVMSGANGFFDFYMESMQAGLLDSDVIDVSAGHTSVAILRNAIPVGAALVLLSDLVQFQVVSGEDGILSPKTISLEAISTNESEPLVRPHSFGGSIIFPFTRGLFAGVTEMFPSGQAKGVWSFNTLTDQVPQYLSGDVVEFAVDNRLGVIVALCAGDPSTLYIFKEFLGVDQERLQAAWFRYSFTSDANIRAVNFLGGVLYLHIQRGAVTTLETLEFNSAPVDPDSDFMVRIDRRVDEAAVTSAVYSGVTDTTVITYPYTLGSGDVPIIVSRADGTNVAGNRPEVTSSDSTSVTVRGDWSSAPFWAGVVYEMVYQFAKPQLRAQEGRGTSALQTGRIQVTKGILVHDGTGYFQVGVTLPTRDEVVKSFGPVVSGPGSLVGNLINSQALQDGRFSFHVMGKADDAVVVVRNDSPFPSNFQKAEWEIQYNSKATRFRG